MSQPAPPNSAAAPMSRWCGAGSAAEALFFCRGAFLDRSARRREVMVELSQRDAGVLLLIGARQRHAQLQQFVGRLGAFGIALIAFREGARRFGITAARVIGLAEPILRVARHRIVRVLLDKGLQ